jgi:hypothetical protein
MGVLVHPVEYLEPEQLSSSLKWGTEIIPWRQYQSGKIEQFEEKII